MTLVSDMACNTSLLRLKDWVTLSSCLSPILMSSVSFAFGPQTGYKSPTAKRLGAYAGPDPRKRCSRVAASKWASNSALHAWRMACATPSVSAAAGTAGAATATEGGLGATGAGVAGAAGAVG